MKDIARWTAIVALFTIPFLPLYISDGLFFPFITGKAFAFRILVEIALAAWIVLALIDRRYRPQFSWVLVLFGALVGWMAVANALGVYPVKALWSTFERMDGWITLIHLIAFFLVSSAVLRVEKLWRKWWFYFVAVAGAVCLYGLVQLGGGAEIHQGGMRLTASLGNAIYLAVYLMFALFASAWLAATSRGGVRYALIAFMMLAAIVLFFTGSRGPLVGLAAGTGFAALLWLFLAARGKKDAATRQGIKIAAAAIAVIVLAGGSLFLGKDTSFVRDNAFLARAASVFNLDEELRVRGTIWSIALAGAQEDLLTGWGQEGFNQVFNKYYDPSLYEQEQWFDRVHNMYLDWLIAGGLPALTFFVALLAVAAVSLVRSQEFSRVERVILVSALMAYVVQALVVFDNLFSYVPLVMLLAMAHVATGRPIPALERLPVVHKDSHALAVGGVALLITAGMVWTVNMPIISTSHRLIVALTPAPDLNSNLVLFKGLLAEEPPMSQEVREQLVTFAARVSKEERIPAAVKEEFAVFAVEEMGKEVLKNPNDARLHVMLAQAYETAGEAERSLAQIEEAIRLSPKKQSLHLNRAFKLYELGRIEESKEAFAYAYELDPSFDSVAISAASGYLLAGDVAGAREILLEAVGTTTPDSDSLFFAYYEAKQWNELVGVARARVDAENGSAKSRYRLAQALAAARRFAEARAEISATITAYPETRAEGEALLAQIPTLRR